MKKLIVGLLLIFSINVLLASSHPSHKITRMVIGDEPADFTFVSNGKNRSPAIPITLVEEELTNSYFSNYAHKSCVFAFAENQKNLQKYRETIEDSYDERNDPSTRLTANFAVATHILKGSVIYDHGCTMVNLRIEDRKGCVRAQKKISVSDMSMWQAVEKLTREAARSLGYQLCNPKSNEQTCSKAHYSDKLSCPLYFVITTTTEYNHQTKKTRPKGAAISGPKVLTSSYISSHKSKQIMYVDPKNGIVKLVGLKGDATSRYESERYKLDKKQCAFIHKRDETKVNKSLQSSLAKIVRHNIFEANNNAFIELKVTNNNFRKKFKIPWATLKDSGSWSGNGSKNTYDAPSAKDKAIQDSIKNTEIYKMVTVLDKGFANSGMLAKTNDDARKTAAILGLNKEWLCTIYEGELAYGYQKIDLSFNAKINVDISPATKSEIDLMRNISDNEDIQTYRAREIKLSKFEKEPQSIFDGLQNSLYDDISQDDKKAWDRADKEHKKAVQNKKDLEEYNNLSIDDLEMFTK